MSANKLYSDADWQRVFLAPESLNEPYRTPARKDYARIIHSPCFRRLQGKTQLYQGYESDFFRNRLTHSLEVAQISKGIAIKLNYEHKELSSNPIDLDVAEAAGLIHDLGHPPFGHNGEDALDECMMKLGGFEGNAQTLRMLARLEKKELNCPKIVNGVDQRSGLNLCYRTLASALKYDKKIPLIRNKRSKPTKGYYISEEEIVSKIKSHVAPSLSDDQGFKTLECQIMDLADDIAYSTYDLEDSFKAGFLSPLGLYSSASNNLLLDRVVSTIKRRTKLKINNSDVLKVLDRVFSFLGNIDSVEPMFDASVIYTASTRIKECGYYRSAFTSERIKQALDGVEFIYNPQHPCLSEVKFNNEMLLEIEVLKNLTFVSMIMSPRLKIVEHRGKQIVREIFEALYDQADGYLFMPDDFQQLYRDMEREEDRARVICDFIAGMTDRYALEFYGRLKSASPESIFKPI